MKHRIAVAATALIAVTNTQAIAQDFEVQAISGNTVILDRLWDGGCQLGTNGIDWTLFQRTLIGLELETVLVDFQNGSAAPDCENGRAGFAAYTQTLQNDGQMVPVQWIDATGMPAAAPAGLEDVVMANGASGTITIANVTPQTADRAAQLSQAEFCGVSDWQVEVSPPAEVIIQCFTGGINPGKGTIVVDDRELPWKIYDGFSVNPAEYPGLMPNFAPHRGPFEPKS